MKEYVVQRFSGGWIVRDMKGNVLVKTPTEDEAWEWITDQMSMDRYD